jgi:hypothetical protein
VPKLTQYPRLRVHVRKGKNARVYTYFFYDMRGEGVPDIALGRDREEAIAKWDELHNNKPRIKGTMEEAFLRWEEEKLPEYTNEETKRGYAKSLKWLRKVFKSATWDATKLVHLVDYLKARKGKTQANREMALLSLIWHQAQMWGMTTLPYPAAGLKRSKWKNKESAREFEVTDELFEAVYAEAGQMLRDCMDLSTATGMRLTDCRTILLPADNILHLKARKTGKKADFDLALSQVLPDLLARRRAMGANHLMLLSTPDGFPVFAKDLRREYDKARSKAAAKAKDAGHKEFADEIKAMVLRDMRKRASDLSESDEDASQLLQHSSVNLTRKHYRSRATKLKPVR